MIKVKRSDIVDNAAYQKNRESFEKDVSEIKKNRRVQVGKFLAFEFVNTMTSKYEIQEWMLSENIESDSEINQALEQHNSVLGDKGELSCKLLVEIKNEKERSEKLTAWIQLPKHIFMILEDGTEIPAKFEETGENRLLPIQTLKFEVGATSPVGFKITLPGLELDSKFSEVKRIALTEDLRSDL